MQRDEQDLIRILISQPVTHAYSAVGTLAGPALSLQRT